MSDWESELTKRQNEERRRNWIRRLKLVMLFALLCIMVAAAQQLIADPFLRIIFLVMGMVIFWWLIWVGD
jgi:hypothetical protein